MSFSRDEFLAQRAPRRGLANPERMRVPLWEWLVGNPISAHEANDKFGTPGHWYTEPGWCFQRFGCSRTELPDGRILHIAGEHEDHYDPDFYIYNDVIVEHPDGQVEILGYPVGVFPPTDSHTATRIADGVWIVGSIGYAGRRQPGTTPVYHLDLDTMAINVVETTGEVPGWIYDHAAWFEESAGRIVIRRGVVQTDDAGTVSDAVDDWALDVTTRVWSRLTRHPYEAWNVSRQDAEELKLFEMDTLAFETKYAEALARHPLDPETENLMKKFDPIAELLASGHCFDLEVFESRFAPPVPHERTYMSGVDEDDLVKDGSQRNMRNDTCRLQIGAACVRYVEGMHGVSVRIEGELDADTRRLVLEDLREKLAVLQGAVCEVTAAEVA